MISTEPTAQARYETLTKDRQPYLTRAREAAELTIPALMPPDGSNGHTKLATPWQGVGARGVNNLASKLSLALLPANTPFFKLNIDDYTLEELTQREGMRAEVEEALNKVERAVQVEIESEGFRPTIFEANKHLVVAGNCLLYLPPKGGIQLFRLDHYVTHRDPSGETLEIITKEEVHPNALDDEVLDMLDQAERESKEPLPVYTWVKWDAKANKWRSHVEIKDKKIAGTEGTYPKDKCPWIPLRFTKIDGEHYGRGYVEEYIGDLKSLEALTQAMVEGTAAASKVIIFVNPNGVTQARQIKNADNLAILSGDANDLSVFRVEKMADFQVASSQAGTMEIRLQRAFLLESSVQRQGERVTAEEIRYMAGELEDTLGGVYSIQARELQLPLVRATMSRMEAQGRLPSLPEGAVRPTITAGMEALGRGHDLSNLLSFLQALTPLAQVKPEILDEYIVPSDFITRIGTGHGIDMAGLVRTEQEVMERRQQQQMEQMMAEMAPEALPKQQ